MATDDLEQLKKKAEQLEQLVQQKEQQRELKKRIKTAKASLRKDTLVSQSFTVGSKIGSQLFTALKKKVNEEIK